ncbi:MAG TPA: glycosyltransferase family A protein, partial [Chitinophagaceae bacterium]|nr:glycosyltransferase family A protein [Chitinophagaceae bacterium]
ERGAARNFGLRHAKGDYAVFFDSDDLMNTHYLETLHKIIVEYPEVKLLAAKYNYDKNGKREDHPFLQNLAEGWYDQGLFLKGNILACNYCIKIKDHSFKLFPPDRELASMEDWLFLLENLTNEKIFIKNEICITMRQHDERSMGNNQKVIEARRKATDWILARLKLSATDKKILLAWSHYFCGIHEYLDHKRRAAIREAMSAIKADGLQKHFLLLLGKSIVGRRLIKTIR